MSKNDSGKLPWSVVHAEATYVYGCPTAPPFIPGIPGPPAPPFTPFEPFPDPTPQNWYAPGEPVTIVCPHCNTPKQLLRVDWTYDGKGLASECGNCKAQLRIVLETKKDPT